MNGSSKGYPARPLSLVSAIDPEGAKVVFENWKDAIPEWYRKITMWLVASIIGVKKIGDYLPGVIVGIKSAMRN